MAANEVKLTIRVGDDGTLDVVAKKSKQAAKETENLGKATDKTTKSRNKYSRGEKGVAGATANGTKAFSKMRDSMTGGGGLVPAYATLAANVFALSAAFGVLQRAAQLEQLKQGFEVLANSAGRTASVIVDSIQKITDGAVSADAAFRAAAAGFNAGFSSIEIERLTQIAKTASQALGRNLTDSLDRLIRGTAKLEPEILDELGIFVRLDDAVRRYAETLNKAASDLTQAERRQAFLNSALEQGELKFSGLGDSIPANPFEKLAANFDKVAKTFLNIAGTVLGPIVNLLASSTIALVGVLILFGKTITAQIFPVLNDLGGKYRELAEGASQAAKTAKKEQKSLLKEAKKGALSESSISSKSKFAKIQAKLQKKEKVSIQELREAKKSLMVSEKARRNNLQKYSGEELVRKQAELAAVEAQTAAVERLILAEKGLTGPQIKTGRANRLKDLEQGVSNSVADIQSAGTLDGFKKARKGLADYRKDKLTLIRTTESFRTGNKRLDRMLKKIAISFRVGGVAARLFGTALLNAIPVIGQIIFAVGLVVTAFSSLAKAVFGPSDAIKNFQEIVESSAEKIKQLEEANDKLASKYYSVLIGQEQNKKGVKTLTKARLEEIQATAESFAAVERHANTLKVTAGITTEFAGAVDGLAASMREDEPGFIGSLATYLTNGIFAGIQAAIRGIKMAFSSLKDMLTDNVITRAFAETAEFLGNLGKKLFPELARNIDIAPVLAKTESFKSQVINQFNDLEESAPAAAKALEQNLGQPFEEFVEAQFKGIDAFKDYASAQQAFERGSIAISGVLQQNAKETNAASNAITNFAENVRESGASLASFRNKFFKKGEFGELAVKVQETSKAVKALQEAADRPGSETSFAAALERAVAAGEINLGDYGLKLEEVQEKGAEAFKPLIDSFTQLDIDTRNAVENMKGLRAELDNVQASASFRELTIQLFDVREGLRTTGKASQTVGRALDDINDKYQDRLEDIKEEASIRKEMINAEIDLELLKLSVLKVSSNINKEQLALITALEERLEKSREQRTNQVDTQAGSQTLQAGINFLKEGEQLRNKLVAIAQTGDSTGQRLLNLGTQFDSLGVRSFDALNLVDEAGNILGYNFTGKVNMVVSALQPMIDAFKELGPDGAVAGAFAEGMVMMGQAAANLGDAITQNLNIKAVESMAQFEAAWKSATDAERAAVMSAAFAAAASSIGALAGALKEQSNAAVSAIDEQIEREKKLDGKSAESAKRIQRLEAKKEQIKRKAFETDKKLRLAQAVASTAAGVAGALSLAGKVPPGVETALAIMIGAMGAAQIAIISGLSYKGASASDVSQPTSVNVGQRSTSVDLARSQGGAGELAYFRGARGQGGPENFRPAFMGYKNRAEGGSTGLVVGEQGPELFVPETPGRIIPADDVRAPTPINANINISAIDAEGVEDVLINQRGNIISMIREAANAQGNTFLEEVNVAEL